MSLPMRPMSVAEPIDSSHDHHAPAAAKTRLKRLRLLAVLLAVLALGGISFVFGLFVEITSELPSLTRFALYKEERSSVLLDDQRPPDRRAQPVQTA